MRFFRYIRAARFALALWCLRKILVGKNVLWVSEVQGQTAPQMLGRIISLRVKPGLYGGGDSIIFLWSAPGMSLQDARHVDVKKLRRDRKIGMWVFNDG